MGCEVAEVAGGGGELEYKEYISKLNNTTIIIKLRIFVSMHQTTGEEAAPILHIPTRRAVKLLVGCAENNCVRRTVAGKGVKESNNKF